MSWEVENVEVARTAPAGDAALSTLRAVLAAHLSARELELPLLPQAASEVLAATHRDDVDVARLVALLNGDPALASHVLRVANSPAYLPRTPIVSLQQAVTRLGMRTVGEIALMVSLRSKVFLAPEHESEVRAVWRHAAGAAAYAKEIARLKRTNVEIAFLCGLLHTIGKPVVLHAAIEVAAELELRPRRDELTELMGELHVPAGRLLATAWRLPAPVADSIAIFADYRTTEAPEPMLTFLAARLASHVLDGVEEDEALRAHPVFGDLNLYPEDVDSLLAKRDAVLSLVDALAA